MNQDHLKPSDSSPHPGQDEELEAYIRELDHTLIAESLKLTVEQRIRKAQSFHRSVERWRGAAQRISPPPNRTDP